MTTAGNDNIAGSRLWQSFSETVVLSTIMRQLGPEQQAFRDALGGLRENHIEHAHWRTLTSRVKAVLSNAEIARFDNAIRLYFSNKEVAALTHDRLRDLGNPVLPIHAKHDHPDSALIESRKVSNLQSVINVSIGARLMLLDNVWTEHGLVNGRQGDLVDIIWPVGTDDCRQEPPLALLIDFDLSDDAPTLQIDNGRKVVPIFRVKREFDRNGKSSWREQFPVTVSYALTVHKAQGMTLDKVVLNVNHKEHAVGLTHVAISRAKEIGGVMFEEAFDFTRLNNITGGQTGKDRTKDEERRHHQIMSPPSSSSPPLMPRRRQQLLQESHRAAIPTSNYGIEGITSDFERLGSDALGSDIRDPPPLPSDQINASDDDDLNPDTPRANVPLPGELIVISSDKSSSLSSDTSMEDVD